MIDVSSRDSTRRIHLLACVPSLFLIAIAFNQIHLAHTAALSPWKGGGFGMFSSTELSFVRHVRIFISAPDRSEELEIPQSLLDLAQRAGTLPAEKELKKLAMAVVEREQRKKQPVSQIRIEVWRSEYEKETLAAVTTKIRVYVYEVD